MEQKYTNEGVLILFPYKDGLVAKFPKCCNECPIGFRWDIEGGCGVGDNDMQWKQRSPTCKLKLLNINNSNNEVNPDDELE